MFPLALRLYRRLGDAELRGLRESVLAWARLVVERRLHLDLGGVDDMAEVDRLQEPDEVEAYWEARRQAMFEVYRAEGREAGRAEARAEERALLRRQAVRRFGDDVAARLAGDPWLEGVDDAERLVEVADWIVDCATGAELIARLEEAHLS